MSYYGHWDTRNGEPVWVRQALFGRGAEDGLVQVRPGGSAAYGKELTGFEGD